MVISHNSMFVCLFQVWMTLAYLGISGGAAEVAEISMFENHCFALKEKGSVLKIDGLGQVILRLDLTTLLTNEIVAEYSRRNDQAGLGCVLNGTARISESLLNFKKRVGNLQQERFNTEYYLSSNSARNKRFEPGTIAILLSILAITTASSGLIVTEKQIGQINNRLEIMSKNIEYMRETQNVMAENFQFLYEDSEFVGLETTMIAEYVNRLKKFHSCDILSSFFEIMVMSLEKRLDGIFHGLISRRLSEDIIGRDALRRLTKNGFFGSTIYLLNPTALYEFGQVDFVFLSHDKLDIMLSFPVIGRLLDYKRIVVVESPMNLIFDRDENQRYYSFLMPIHVDITNISYHLDELRVGRNCLINGLYEACDHNSNVPYNDKLCIGGLVNGISSHCQKRQSFVFDFHISPTEDAALVYLKNDARIFDVKQRTVLVQADTENPKCAFLTNNKDVFVESMFRRVPMSVNTAVFTIDNPKPVFVLPGQRPLDNFTMPTRNHDKSFVPIVFDVKKNETDVYLIIGISVGGSVGFLVLMCIVIRCIMYKCRVVDGQSMFP